MSNAIFGIPQIPEKEWEYIAAVHQLLIDLKKAYDVVRREILCSVDPGYRDALYTLLFNSSSECHWCDPSKPGGTEAQLDTTFTLQ
jgi:hypothetical protein